MCPCWRCRHKELNLDNGVLLMGIVNCTPDSFSDGGLYFDSTKAIKHAYRQFEQGAHILDVGGASSRPGADPVSPEEELRRVLPVVSELAGNSDLPVSVDTFSYEVAARCLDAGAVAVNDITGLQSDARLADLVAQSGAGLVLMHMRGAPKTMQMMTDYHNLEGEIKDFFQIQVDLARSKGVEKEQIALDPGIGFSKTAEQNLSIIKHLDRVRYESYPLLLGVSRKSFIGKVTGAEVNHRLMGTAGAVAACIMNGTEIVRVHDVEEMREVSEIVNAIKRGTLDSG